MCPRRLLCHDVDDAANEGAAEACGDVAAVDFDALDVADGDRRDVDRRVAAEVRQYAVDEDTDLRRRRAAYSHRRILPLAVDLTYMDTRHHLEKIGQRLLLALKLLGTDDGHGARRQRFLPIGTLRLDGDRLRLIVLRLSIRRLRFSCRLWHIRRARRRWIEPCTCGKH